MAFASYPSLVSSCTHRSEGLLHLRPPCWLVTPSGLEPRVPMLGLDKHVDIYHFLKPV